MRETRVASKRGGVLDLVTPAVEEAVSDGKEESEENGVG